MNIIPLNSLFRKMDWSKDDMFLHGIKILKKFVGPKKTKKQWIEI